MKETKTGLIGKAGFIGLILILASVIGAYAGYLSYNEPNGSYAWTSTDQQFITGSNGNRYNATGAFLKTATYNLNSTGGTITLPPGGYELTSDFIIDHNVTIIGSAVGDNRRNYMKGTCLNLTGDTSIIIRNGKLQNIQVNTIAGWTGDYAIYVDGEPYLWQTSYILDGVGVHNVPLDHTGTGIGIIAIGTTKQECIAKCSFGPISIYGFNLAMEIDSQDSVNGAYVNGNSFERIDISNCIYGLNVTDSDSGESKYNVFQVYDQQPYAGTLGGIYTNTNGNFYKNCMFWDWTAGYGDTVKCTGIYNIFDGYFAHFINISEHGNLVTRSTYETKVYEIYPNGHMDGTRIKNTLGDCTDKSTVIFHAGTYDINEYLYGTKTNITWYFERGVIFEANASLTNYFIRPGKYAILTGPAVFDANNVSGVIGISCDKINVVIDGITFIDFNSLAISASGPGLIIRNCKVINSSMSSSIYIFGHNQLVEYCNISYSDAQYCYGVHLAGDNSTIRSCTFFNLMSPITASIGMSSAADNCIIDGNYISKSNVIGIYILGAGSSNNTICKNRIFNCTTGYHDRGTDNIFNDNHIRSCTNPVRLTTTSNAVRPVLSNNLGYKYNTLFPFYNQSTAPTMFDDTYAWWYDSDENFFYIVCRVNNTVFYYNTTKTI